MHGPEYRNRSLDQIVDGERLFDSAWYTRQALAWIDYAKRKTNISALQYGALELRQGIEQLWFDMIVTSVGGRLDQDAYVRCKQNATKMYKILKRLVPDYEKLVRFTNICASLQHEQPVVIEWDMPRLMRIHGEIAEYLHFYGIPNETTERAEWFIKAITIVETGASYVWKNLTTARLGQMNIASMPPEVRDTWEDYRTNKIDEGSARTRLELAHPVLRRRRSMR